MDHLTHAFDQAIQNLGMFLDSLTAPPTAPQSLQMGIAGMNTVIIDYLNLLEACCVNHPMLKNKIQVITQKLVALQNTGSLPPSQGAPLASFSFAQNQGPVPNMMTATPLLTNVPALAQHMAGYFGPPGMTPLPMNRPPSSQMPFDAARAYRMNNGYPNYFPTTPLEFYSNTPSPPLNGHQSMPMSETLLSSVYPGKLCDSVSSASQLQL